MQTPSVPKIFLWTLVLLFSSLACQAATRLILPATPTPLPTPTQTPSLTPSPTIPPPSATPTFVAACPSLLAEIMDAATSPQPDSEDANADKAYHDVQDLQYMVTYSLKDDKLGKRDAIYLPETPMKDLDSRAEHERIWDYFAVLIPPEQRNFVTEFSAISDGYSNILGGVSRTLDDPAKWGLRIDILDASNRYSLTFTLMHEFGHLLTLKPSQVALDKTLYYNPDNEDLHQRAVSACPQYFTEDGCSAPESYINEFYNRYWTSLYAEWQEIDQEKGTPSYYRALRTFYKKYQDQFLTDYAPTSPEEDIAESWAFFILSPKPEPTSIANEKVLFFYEYPELVQLRQEILTQVCVDFPQ